MLAPHSRRRKLRLPVAAATGMIRRNDEEGGMIRKAVRSEIPVLAGLWARAFPGERSVEGRIAQLEAGGVFGGVETSWIAEQHERIVGAFRAFALTQHMHGTVYPMMGLAAVAVDETARRRGLGRALCEHAVAVARERGDVLSVLYPFRPSFYEALGWGTVGELRVFRFRPESLAAAGDGGSVRRADAAEVATLGECYERVAAQGNGMLRRNQRIWRHHLEADGVNAYVAGDGRVSGYIIVRYGRTTTPDEKPMYVRELIAEDTDTYAALLGWIAAQQDAWRIVQYDASPDELFEHRLSEPRPPGFHLTRNLWAPTARLIRGPMLRLLDVPQALQLRERWGPAAPLRFGIEVSDPLVADNDGAFEVDFDGSRVTVKRGGVRPLLRLPVAVLAQVFAGELRVRHALTLGRASADGDVSTIDTLFRTDRCFRLLDEF
jgi:predicted acetyltransferase